ENQGSAGQGQAHRSQGSVSPGAVRPLVKAAPGSTGRGGADTGSTAAPGIQENGSTQTNQGRLDMGALWFSTIHRPPKTEDWKSKAEEHGHDKPTPAARNCRAYSYDPPDVSRGRGQGARFRSAPVTGVEALSLPRGRTRPDAGRSQAIL